MVLELRHLEACMHSVCWKSMALHLSETHGSDMDAACTNDAVHPYCVWGAGHCSMAPSRRQMFSWPNWSAKKTTAGDLGPGEVAASHSDCGPFQEASINQDAENSLDTAVSLMQARLL